MCVDRTGAPLFDESTTLGEKSVHMPVSFFEKAKTASQHLTSQWAKIRRGIQLGGRGKKRM